MCQSCWRGQVYCSDECRDAAQCEAHRAAERRYRRTEKGKKAHCEAENRRRMGLTKKSGEIMDDEGSRLQCSCTKIAVSAGLSDEERNGCDENAPIEVGRCHFCSSLGVIVDQFPRRGYGKQDYTVERASVAWRQG